MVEISVSVLTDYARGLIDSITGFHLLFYLDNDEQQTVVQHQARPNAERTVLQKRRERSGSNRPTVVTSADEVAPRVKAWIRVVQCAGINILIAVVLQVLSYLLPKIGSFLTEAPTNGVANFVSVAGIFPIYVFSRIVNALWFSDIAGACKRALKIQECRPVDFRNFISDFINAILLEFFFLLQSAAVMHIPIPVVAPVLSFVHLTLLHSMYCFEYYWMDRREMLNARVAIMQASWVYFVGFGTPLTVAAWLAPNFIVGGCVFGALFPLFIISSFKAASKRSGAFSTSCHVPSLRVFYPSSMLTDGIATFLARHILSQR
ncbi:unnamed protein product, partial [Mesorhabditis spiculigera]